MGLGLIMVAAAFPVGIDQVRRSVQDTESAMAARSALELLRGENIFQNMSETEWDDLVTSRKTLPYGSATVHNPWRQYYGLGGTHPEPGDLLWRAFLTRLTEAGQMPLFRVTIVVVKYSRQSPELYIPDNANQVSSRTILVKENTNGSTIKATSQEINKMVEGNYLMDPYTGFCYRIARFDEKLLSLMYLDTDTDPKIPINTECYVFGNVVGVYYTMISG